MMKKVSVITVLALAIAASSCSDVRRSPGRVYMPDMAYSRAYETYAPIDTLEKQGIHYNRLPVPGTIKRGELYPFALAQDKQGDTTNYVLSKQVASPLSALTATQMVEAERLYLVNCGICHGAALDGNGPLKKRADGSEGPYAAQPAVLVGNATYEKMPAGQMFYSVTYGKGQMGSYASQLTTTQRWMVVDYIKSKQGGNKAAPDSTGKAGAAADTTTAAKPPVSGADTTKAK